MKRCIQYYLLATIIAFGLSSCLEGEPVYEPDGGPAGIVELVLPARTTSTPYAVKTVTLDVVDIQELPVVVNYTGVDGAPSDVQVTLTIDNGAVATYGNETVALPAENYELPASATVTIPKGEKTATYTVKLKPKTFDLTKSYALGIKIQSASTGTVSGNYSTGIFSLPVKSPWQGTYNVHYRWYAGAGFGTADEEYDETGVKLTTAGPGVVEAQYVGSWFGGWTRYTINIDNTVNVESYSGAIWAQQSSKARRTGII